MKQRTINEILLPYKKGIPLEPSVMMGDRIVHALEVMLKYNLKRIAVLQKERPIGMLCVEDVFRILGLEIPQKQ